MEITRQGDNIIAVDLFERFMRLSVADGQAAKNTVAGYRRSLRGYLNWCKENNVNAPKASYDEVQEYRNWLINRYARATVCFSLAAVRVFYRSLQRWGGRRDNPVDGIKAPKDRGESINNIGRKALSRDEALRFMSLWPDDDWQARAALALLLFHGLRVSELISLNCPKVTDDRLEFIVAGKGRKERILYVTGPARSAVLLWSTTFPSRTGRLFDYSVRSLQRMVARQLRAAGLTLRGRGPHALRHTHAMLAVLGGVEREALADEMGHASIRTTDIYSRAAARYQDNPASKIATLLGASHAEGNGEVGSGSSDCRHTPPASSPADVLSQGSRDDIQP